MTEGVRSPKRRAFQRTAFSEIGINHMQEVRAIKNITNIAVDLGVCKLPATVDILSRLKSDSCVNEGHVLVSKKEWAFHLGICEMTLIRWEQNIISPNLLFRVNYWDMKGDVSKLKRFYSGKSMGYRLDYFQRFILSVIGVIKVGAFTEGHPMKYDHEVVTWLEQSPTGQKVKRLFDRDAFNQSTSDNQKRSA